MRPGPTSPLGGELLGSAIAEVLRTCVAAGHDLTATAAQVVADHDVVIGVGTNTANDVHTEDHSASKTRPA